MSHDALVVEARTALPVYAGVKCYGGSRSVPEDESLGETGTREKEVK